MRVEILIFLIPIIAIICGTIISLTKNKREHQRATGSSLNEEEARIMQELHQSLGKMEKRIEALETIIINKK
ncbi:hypothetical protein [Pelagicoccus sp. SDUM812002]|uniref:hypothetical protein n=1 Tax=Pelagicoccus sp. SDUM812002 TaxID=3041266 RepID=UPI00280EC7C7|nr:hypothetical protein [Pelagicoccus sp. SDUM812002]MDQ8184871.1 hypothetical protein [Pelagicoccus sp. SDUM812002]